MKKDIVFKIEEIKSRYNPKYPNNKEDYVHTTTGTATIDGDDITVVVDDEAQPHGMFISTDSKFNKLIKKLFDSSR